MFEDGTRDSDQGKGDSPEVGIGHPAVWRLGASHIPYNVPAQTSVVGWVTRLDPGIFYYSMMDGRPRQRHPLNPHLPQYTTPLVDAQRRSVRLAGVGVWVSPDSINPCRPQSEFEAFYPSGSG